MDTILSSRSREVVISIERPFVIIGERINPTGRKLLAEEMRNASIPFEQDKTVPIRYRGLVLVTGLQIDLLVAGELIVEALSVDAVTDWHRARLLTHLRFSGCPRGLLINFNVADLRRGIQKITLPRRG